MGKYDSLLAGVNVSDTVLYANRHHARSSREGRAWLRKTGDISRHSLDSESKPFIAWDGEGITHGSDGTAQSYCVFGASTGDRVIDPKQLSTKQCLDLMLRVAYENPESIMVGFAIAYDSEMIMTDMDYKTIGRIHKATNCWWGDYRIEFIPKKWLQVTGHFRGNKVTCKIWDVWSFFASSYVKALKTYMKKECPKEIIEQIEDGKKKRGDFNLEEIYSYVIPYWELELEWLVKMMDKLRSLLNAAGLFPTRWHGPASLANFLNNLHGTESHMNRDITDAVKDAAQFAYAAGRVERYMVGRLWAPVYKYDINSAYPSAMVECPSLAGQTWSYREFENPDSNREWHGPRMGLQKFGLYYVDYYMPDCFNHLMPQPLFHRNEDGYISFPTETSGWYWGPEVMQAMKLNYVDSDRPAVIVRAAWEMSIDGVEYPFEWLREMFNTRLEMKRTKDETQLAVKLGMNSMYGKTAQRSGYDRFKTIPRWHQYEWAGYITSATRAKMHEAAMLAAHQGSLIGMETDAIFTSEKVDKLKVDPGLGHWDYEEYDDIVYLQTGVYWLKLKEWKEGCQTDRKGGHWAAKARGMDADTLHIDMALDYLEDFNLNVSHPNEYQLNAMTGMTRTRFVGSKQSLHRNKFRPPKDKLKGWRVWSTDDVDLNIGTSFKRAHNPAFCGSCKNGIYYASGTMHDLAVSNIGIDKDVKCYASKLPWRTVFGPEAKSWDVDPDEDVAPDPSFIP